MQKNGDQKPVEQYKSGDTQIAIWANKNPKDGSTWHSATISRSYKVGNEWKSTRCTVTRRSLEDIVLKLGPQAIAKLNELEQEKKAKSATPSSTSG
jgi:hypothetical protein